MASFLTSKEDSGKFRAAFKKRASYTKPIWGEIKTWVEKNINRWIEEKPAWYNIKLIPDDMLPLEILAAEGGATRRRRSSAFESMGIVAEEKSLVAKPN